LARIATFDEPGSRHQTSCYHVTEAENLDRSVFDLWSIVVLARSGKRTLLLTGVARSDEIVGGLEAEGLLTDD
jgi:hypothetical protein